MFAAGGGTLHVGVATGGGVEFDPLEPASAVDHLRVVIEGFSSALKPLHMSANGLKVVPGRVSTRAPGPPRKETTSATGGGDRGDTQDLETLTNAIHFKAEERRSKTQHGTLPP